MIKKLMVSALLVSSVFFSGCEALGGYVKKSAELNDEALKTAEFTICNAATVGSVKRSYTTPDRSKVWHALCNSDEKSSFNPASVEPI